MNEKSQLMNALKELSDKRLLTSEVESLFEPYKDAVLPLSLSFVSATKSFGAQKDEAFNDGYSLVESFKPEEEFESNVKFIDYDALYQRAIFGKLYSQFDLSDSAETVSSSLADDAISPIELEAEAIELEVKAIQLEAELLGAESDLIDHRTDDDGSKSEARLSLLNSLNFRKELIEKSAQENKQFRKVESRDVPSNQDALPQPSQLEKSGCWSLLLGVFLLMGSVISLDDGLDSTGFILIGLVLCVVGGLSLWGAKLTKNKSGKS